MRRRPWLAVAAAAAALALGPAGCGDSPEDTAHQHGQDVGQAFKAVTDARTPAELSSATQDLKDAVGQVGGDDGDRVQAQLQAQKAHVDQLIGNFKNVVAAPDAATRDAAQVELEGDIQDLRAQADAFRHSSDSVANAFWDGVKDGYDG